MAKPKPRAPQKVNLSMIDQLKLGLMALLQIFLWVVMILAGLHIVIFWGYTLYSKGIFDPATIQYSVLVAVGSYFCLILDKDKINEALNIKKGLTFISTSIIEAKK